MTDLTQAARQALEALTNCSSDYGHRCNRCDSEVDEGGKVAAALQAALEAQQEPEPHTSERHFALREAHAIGASDAYFKVWPIHDNDAGRMLFERGFVRGFDAGEKVYAAPQPAKVEAQQGPAFGWAIVCNDGTTAFCRTRVDNFFGAIVDREPFEQDDVTRCDRESPGLAPHRLVTLYAHPPAQPQGWVLVPEWKLRRAVETLDRDGDEHGVAADLRAMLAARPKETT